MKILAVSDMESPFLWNAYTLSLLKDVELILSCGDLDPYYLSYLATYSHAPVFYVHGNHDDCYAQTPPAGCICIDGKHITYRGVCIAGLGGSMRYKPGTNQYTQAEMHLRAIRLLPRLCLHGGLDILLTHAPAFGIQDGHDLPHTGFCAFQQLIHFYSPTCFVHGHMHLNYNRSLSREIGYQSTRIINAYDHYFFNI